MAHAREFRHLPDAPLAAVSNFERPVTTSQLAEHLQVTERTIATWRHDGLIPFWRINARSFRYRISTVEKALENLR
jgi:excisionase family DNA binding protein